MKKMVYCIILISTFSTTVFAQSNIWDVYSLHNQPYVNVTLARLDNETLYVHSFGETYPIQIDSIQMIKRTSPGSSHALAGFLLGMAGGGLAGNIISRASGNHEGLFASWGKEYSAFFGTGAGMLLGGIFGSAVGAGLKPKETYPFANRTYAEKVELLQKLLEGAPSAIPTNQ